MKPLLSPLYNRSDSF